MTTESTVQQRTRLGAGLLGCSEAEVLGRVQGMPAYERQEFSAATSQLVAYEAEEKVQRWGQ